MSRIKEIILYKRFEYVIFMFLSLGMIIFTWVLFLTNPLTFEQFLGPINPLIIIILIILLGIISLTVLLSNGWFEIYKRKNLKGMLISSILAPSLTLIVILIDFTYRYPENINILFPLSILFYPTIGYVVEVLFHVVPLALLLTVLRKLFKKADQNRIMWISIFIVSLIEPIYQMVIAFPTGFPLWVVIYFFAVHLVLLNMIQLYVFKRYDFLSMYSFRLIYYMIWHVLWGYFRLILFF